MTAPAPVAASGLERDAVDRECSGGGVPGVEVEAGQVLLAVENISLAFGGVKATG